MTSPAFERLTDKVMLHSGDCLDGIRALSDNSVDSCCTDPPYGLGKEPDALEMLKAWIDGGHYDVPSKSGFMGKEWDAFVPQPAVWKEVYRVLKPGAFVVAFFGTRTYDLGVMAMRLAGFEVRDMTAWLYGTGFPKSQNVAKFIDKELGAVGERGAPKLLPNGREHHFNIGFGEGEGYDSAAADRYSYLPASPAAQEFDGFGTALKPAFEPIVLARKPLSEPTVAANVLRWRTGALNIDGCRVEANDGANRARPPRTANEILGGGKGTNLTASPHNDSGRWPANVVHDGSDEVVGAFPHTTSGKPGVMRKGKNDGACYGAESRPPGTPMTGFGDSGSAARFFYSAKASRTDRAGSKHPTVKPVALMQWLCRLVTPPGGVILDPFAGSGTTGAACLAEGFQSVLCERDPEYQADIRTRIAVTVATKAEVDATEFQQPNMFADVPKREPEPAQASFL